MNRALANKLLGLYVAVLAIYIISPVFVVVVTAFSSVGYFTFPPPGFSFQWFIEIAQQSEWVESLQLSLTIAAIVATCATVLGTLAALGLRHYESGVGNALQTFLLSPLMLPTMLIGLALLEYIETLGWKTSLWTIVLGHVIITSPYVIRMVLASLSSVDQELGRAARILGASPMRVFFNVTLPLSRHGVIAGALFAFIVSMDDVNVAMFLSDIHTSPLAVRLFTYIEQNADPVAAAVATVMVVLAGVLILTLDRIVGIEWMFGIGKRSKQASD